MTLSLGELKVRAASLAESADEDDRAEAAWLLALIAVAEAAAFIGWQPSEPRATAIDHAFEALGKALAAFDVQEQEG